MFSFGSRHQNRLSRTTLTEQILSAPDRDKLGSIVQKLCQSLRVGPELYGSFHYLKSRWIRCRVHREDPPQRRNGVVASGNRLIIIDDVVFVLVRTPASQAQGLEGSRFTGWQLYRSLAGGSRE